MSTTTPGILIGNLREKHCRMIHQYDAGIHGSDTDQLSRKYAILHNAMAPLRGESSILSIMYYCTSTNSKQPRSASGSR
jgi:hypothetical protein